MWRVRKFFKSVSNLVKWFPIIWNDRDWDHYYIFEVLKHKLTFMSKSIREKDNHTLAEYDANRMMLAVRLIEKVQNESYMDELINDDELTVEKIRAGQKKHDKAKRILFKLLDNYIEKWWD